MRNTHATLLRKAKVDLSAVQKALGHSDPRITASTYDHGAAEDQRAEVEAALSFGGVQAAEALARTTPPLHADSMQRADRRKAKAPEPRLSPSIPGPSRSRGDRI
jgi:hypothetical protein